MFAQIWAKIRCSLSIWMSLDVPGCPWMSLSLVGFSADAPVYTADGAVAGVQLRDVGIGKDGKEKDTFEPGEMQCQAVSN